MFEQHNHKIVGKYLAKKNILLKKRIFINKLTRLFSILLLSSVYTDYYVYILRTILLYPDTYVFLEILFSICILDS